MIPEDKLLEHIDAYLKGQLPTAEAAAMEQEMAIDTALARRVSQQRLHLLGLELLLEDDLRAKMQVWKTEVPPPRPPLTGQWKFWVLGLGLVGLLAGLLGWLKWGQLPALPGNGPASIEQQFLLPNDTVKASLPVVPRAQDSQQPNIKRNAKTSPRPIAALLDDSKSDLLRVLAEIEVSKTTRGTIEDAALLQVCQSIRSKDYALASEQLREISGAEGTFLLAVTHFFSGRYAQALPLFDTLSTDKGFARAEMAEYCAAICVLEQGQTAAARRRFLKMAGDGGHQFSERARLLIEH